MVVVNNMHLNIEQFPLPYQPDLPQQDYMPTPAGLATPIIIIYASTTTTIQQ
eukprot:UN08803